MMNSLIVFGIAIALSCSHNGHMKVEHHGKYDLIRQKNGPSLGYSPSSGVGIIIKDGHAFKDLAHDGRLHAYEDWRLSPEDRAEALAHELSIEEIAGLMLFSSHQQALDTVITPVQRKLLCEDNIRHLLLTKVSSPRQAAQWSNDLQATAESLSHGIPVNISSDPRNYTEADSEHNAGSGGDISHWPREVGLGATFDLDLIRRHGEIISSEYRALGITTALSPQVDLNTDPRWRRFNGTFSEGPLLATDIARTYIDAIQTSTGEDEISGGWGWNSVNAMVKHWPGGGAQEGGRDSHFGFGKYSVYPGGNFRLHQLPFVEGAFQLEGPTGRASAAMSFYTASWGIDPSGDNVGQSYSRYMIDSLLRRGQNFDGVVCTDWVVTGDYVSPGIHGGKPWGVETLTVAQRHLRVIESGCDQFGGNDEKDPVLQAYSLYVQKYGEKAARKRFELSAKRLLVNIFRTGLFENPYLDPDRSEAIVGCKEYVDEGYMAQMKSIVMLKNHGNVIPVSRRLKVYVPSRSQYKVLDFWTGRLKDSGGDCLIPEKFFSKYYDVVSDPQQADFAVVAIKSPEGNFGYDRKEHCYLPISLQYEDYTATSAREHSIAGGDPYESDDNRSYLGKTEKTYNRCDMLLVKRTREEMGSRPVIVAVMAERPFVPSEIEPSADAILLALGISGQAVVDLIHGEIEPYGLLPMQMPSDMDTVERQDEDTPFDMKCYVDSDGNVYDYAYGLNWSGVISDERTERYGRKK